MLAHRIFLMASFTLLAACLSSPSEQPSEWPPPDFYLEVECSRHTPETSQTLQKFQVWSDGLAVYREADANLQDAAGEVRLPVFRRVCSWRMLPDSTRSLARKLYLRGVLDLQSIQGDVRQQEEGKAILLRYQAFGRRKNVVARGQIHGTMVRVLHVVNSYVPPGAEFDLPGMVGDREPQRLTELPQPADGLEGALQFHRQLMDWFPEDAKLVLDSFTLACSSGDRALAEQLLARYLELTEPARREGEMFPTEDEGLTPERLRRLLPAE